MIDWTKFGIPIDYAENDYEKMKLKYPEAVIKIIDKYMSEFDDFRERGQGLYLYGKVGTGKTAISFEIMKKILLTKKYTCFFSSARKITELSVKTWKDDKSQRFYQKKVKDIDFLFIDDLGKDIISLNKMVIMVIDELIRYRVMHRLPIIVTSNLNIKDISLNYTPSVGDMLTSKCFFIEFVDSRNFRERQGKKVYDKMRE